MGFLTSYILRSDLVSPVFCELRCIPPYLDSKTARTIALNINSSHLLVKFSQPANQLFRLSWHVHCRTRIRSSSVVTLARPSVYSSLKITNRSFKYSSPYLWNQLPSSFRQPLPTWFTSSCVHHLISHHSPHFRAHHLSLPEPFTPDLKLICFTNPFLHSLSGSFGLGTAFEDLGLGPELVGTGVCLF